jgi:hypothetical protein
MRGPLRLHLLAMAASIVCGCHGPSGNEPESGRGYRILDFTVLGDSALALRIETWDAPNPAADTAPWPRTGFVLLDRKRGTLRTLDTLPPSAAPTFPAWFFACDSGRPVSVHPQGYSGPAGACSQAYPPAISPEGYALAFADSQGRVNLLSRELEPITYLATRADSVMPLEYASAVGHIFVLEWYGREDRVLWRGFANDDPSGSDTAWLLLPGRVRVHGAGIKLVCAAAETSQGLQPCWSPPGISGFGAAFAEAQASALLPEWDPDTGILAYLDGTGRFVFLNPVSGERVILAAAASLSGYRP